ncbi:hypothetical protein [Kitasatospora sp. NPDC059673]
MSPRLPLDRLPPVPTAEGSTYPWIEAGTTLLLLALVQFGAVLRPV